MRGYVPGPATPKMTVMPLTPGPGYLPFTPLGYMPPMPGAAPTTPRNVVYYPPMHHPLILQPAPPMHHPAEPKYVMSPFQPAGHVVRPPVQYIVSHFGHNPGPPQVLRGIPRTPQGQ